MTDFLDRAYQHELLVELAQHYPQRHHVRRNDGDKYVKNIHYLHELRLVEANFSQLLNGTLSVNRCKISARGLDFLQDDGGMSAILNLVTVKLHDDTIRQLLIEKVQDAQEDPTVKAELVDAIRTAPAELLKSATQKALEAGIQNLPNAVQLLQGWLAP